MKKLPTVTTAIILLFAITGCGSSWYAKRDVKKLQGLSLQYPNEFARLSNELSPCFKGIAKSDTVIRYATDTVINSVERLVPGKPGKPDTLYIPGETIRNNVYTTVHDTLPDNRALNACAIIEKTAADSLLVMKTQNTQLISDKGSLIKWVIGLGIMLLSIIGVSIYKFFSGGAIVNAAKNII